VASTEGGLLDHLRQADTDALLVSAADKLHNSAAILDDDRRIGEELWGRFNSARCPTSNVRSSRC